MNFLSKLLNNDKTITMFVMANVFRGQPCTQYDEYVFNNMEDLKAMAEKHGIHLAFDDLDSLKTGMSKNHCYENSDRIVFITQTKNLVNKTVKYIDKHPKPESELYPKHVDSVNVPSNDRAGWIVSLLNPLNKEPVEITPVMVKNYLVHEALSEK